MSTTRVLIVDDSVTIRAVMEQLLLHDPKFDVVGIAAGVDEARKMMHVNSHDVVTIDLTMPGMDGLAFLDELATRRHAPVVVVSSATKSGTDAETEAMARGAFACFDKAKILSDAQGFLRILHKAGTTRKR